MKALTPLKRRIIGVLSFGSLLALALVAWLWVGIYEDPEFGEWHLSFKKHPTFKVFFWSPRGESDMRTEQMPPETRKTQEDYDHYIGR
jgi:hypothetical protein